VNQDKTEKKQHATLEVRRTSASNNQAMMAALWVVLGLPKKPITLKDIDDIARLDISQK
jgi:hypothetical protein